MNWIQELREKYGLQQEQLAFYLSIARSTLAQAETDKRELPTRAMLKLAPLLKEEKEDLTDEIAALVKQQSDEEEALLQKQTDYQVQQNQRKLYYARQRLAAMQQKQEQATNAMQLAYRLSLQSPINEQEAAYRKAFTHSLLTNALLALKANGRVAQAMLESQIKVYEVLSS
ncbi:helix-turn-helix transcriptional regulator [Parasediminibacterium sp. JCM 36343]|uniref:helix-turn-helix transcriptional regulator n=1 Tax=Parasediminibacterium sp. JCM 36343 TaxID=3374279 RepID=UPI003979EECB